MQRDGDSGTGVWEVEHCLGGFVEVRIIERRSDVQAETGDVVDEYSL